MLVLRMILKIVAFSRLHKSSISNFKMLKVFMKTEEMTELKSSMNILVEVEMEAKTAIKIENDANKKFLKGHKLMKGKNKNKNNRKFGRVGEEVIE